ncbi:MAG: phosphopantetheine-binding protein [Candidatus Binatia bacterium]
MQTAKLIGCIRAFIEERFPLARKREMSDEVHLLESGILDSLGVLDVVTFMEQEFGIIVADEELVPENFQSMSAMARFVEQKQSQSN